jgi:hypothetical protein
VGGHGEPLRAGAPAQLLDQRRVGVERGDVDPAAGQVERDPPGPGADVEDGARRLGGQLAPELQVHVVAAALQVVPAHGVAGLRGHPKELPATPRRTSSRRRASIAVYVGSANSRAPSPAPPSAASSAGGQLGLDVQPVLGHPRVLQAQGHLGRPRARADRAADLGREELEVGVPDPRHVAPVGDLVVEDGQDVVLARLERERPQHLVGARGILDEHDRHVAARDPDGLRAAERGRHAARPAAMSASGAPSRWVSAAAARAL